MSETPQTDKAAAQAAMFGNRLEKGLRRGMTWAKRHDVWAWRVYDCDIFEVLFSFDRYTIEGGEVHVVLAYYEGRFPYNAT